MDINEAVKKATRVSKSGNKVIDWSEVVKLVDPNEFKIVSKFSVRSKWRRENNTLTKPNTKPVDKSKQVELLRKLLKEPQTLNQLVDKTGMSDIEVLGQIGKLKNKGEEILDFGLDGEAIFVSTSKSVQSEHQTIYEHYHDFDKLIRIGLVSDTHMCNKCEQHTYLQMAYDDFVKQGISRVYHAGDISDGYYQHRKGHIYELHKIGFDQQKDYIVKNYPKRDGVQTSFITGNHDYTHVDNGGSNIGPAIDKERSDMDYLGYAEATIMLTENVDMRLFHPDGGISYAYSYKPQKMVDTMTGGMKPKILIIGHYHKFFMMFYRNVWIICMPCFEAQTGFMMRNNLVSEVGYIILEMVINKEGDIIDFNPHFKPFYKMLKDDYVK